MNSLEIIELRLVGTDRNKVEENLKSLVNKLIREEEVQKIKIFNRFKVDTDFSIHLFHDQHEVKNGGSRLGLRITSALKEFGLVNHSIWIEMANN